MEEEQEEYKGGKIEEWDEEKDKEDWWRLEEDRKYLEELGDENQDVGNLRDPYNKLWRSPWDKDPWRGSSIMNCLLSLS